MERRRLAVLLSVLILLDTCHHGQTHALNPPALPTQQQHHNGHQYAANTTTKPDTNRQDAAIYTAINQGTDVKNNVDMTVHHGINIPNNAVHTTVNQGTNMMNNSVNASIRQGINTGGDAVNRAVRPGDDIERDGVPDRIDEHETHLLELIESTHDNQSVIFQQNLVKLGVDRYNDPAVLYDYIHSKLMGLNISTNLSDFDCSTEDSGFHRHVMGIPLAEEMYDLVSVCLLIIQGCQNESWARFLELSDLLDDPELLSDMFILLVQGVENVIGSDLHILRPVSKEALSQVEGSIQNTTAHVRVLESKKGVEEELGVLKCDWQNIVDPPDHLCSVRLHSHRQEYTGYLQPTEALLMAKLFCERHNQRCLGVYSEQNGTCYSYIQPCSGTNLTFVQEKVTTLWIKGECFENKTSLGPNIQSTSHLHRRNTGAEGSLVAYEHGNFFGRQQSFQGAIEFVGDDFNDMISSMKCNNECSVITFEHRDFQGRQRAFTGMVNYVGDVTNDIISSLVVLPYPITELCFRVFEHSNFNGYSKRFCGDQGFISTFWNKKVSSLKVECEGCSLLLYDRSYAGRFKSFSNDVSYVGDEWNDATTSVQIRPWVYDNYEGQLQSETWIYEHGHYRGQRKVIFGQDSFVGDVLNDKVSSVLCNGECSILVFEHSEFKGDAKLYSGSQTLLPNFNDKLSSLLVLMHDICVVFYEHSHYRGRSVRYCQDVSYVQWNDMFSSLKVECDFCSVIAYEHSEFGGSYKAFQGHISWVGHDWNDMITSIQIRPWKLDNYESKASCVNAEEQKAHNVLEWIPFLSFFYNLGTSIYYGAVGCDAVVQQRALGMALDTVFDAATVLTFGAFAPIAFGVKTGLKSGIKAGMKAAMKAAVATTKNTIKNGMKHGAKIVSRGIQTNIRRLGSKAVNTFKGIGLVAKSVPSSIKTGISSVQRGVQSLGRNGIKATAKKVASKTKTLAKKKFDDLADSGRKQIERNRNSKALGSQGSKQDIGVSKSEDSLLCRVRRMVGLKAGCSTDKQTAGPTNTNKGGKETGRERLLKAQDRAMERGNIAKGWFEDINKIEPKMFKYTSKGAKAPSEMTSIRYTVPDESETLEVLHNLQHYNDLIKEQGGKLIKPNGKVEPSKYALVINMQIGGEPFEFVLMPGRNRQTFINFSNKIDPTVSHSYDGIIKQLDGDSTVRKKAADAILDTVSRGKRTGDVVDWGDLTPKQKEAAKELIVLTHVAEPAVPLSSQVDEMLSMSGDPKKMKGVSPNSVEGGVGGIDKMARNQIRKIQNDPESWTFHKVFEENNGRFVIARRGGKKTIKTNIYTPENTRQQREFDLDTKDMSEDSNKRKRRSMGI